MQRFEKYLSGYGFVQGTKTLDIAKQFGCKVYNFKWCDDFAKARNYAFSKAKCDYVMWLDADDIVPTQTLKFLKKLKNSMYADCYMLRYDIAFVGDKPTFSYFRERILKNCDNAVWQGRVHECIVPFGKIEHLNCSIEHRKTNFKKSNRNLKIYQKLKKERQLNPREQYYYSRELYDHKKYKQAIKEFNKFINSKQGWKENVIDALFLLAECYLQLNDINNYLLSLFKTFQYDLPRANVCCKIGDYFLNNKNYEIANYWYLQATKAQDVTNKGGFVENLYYNYYPYLQLCVCSYNLGKIKDAILYNEMAGKFVNDSQIVKNNKLFFEKLKVEI